MGGIDKDPLAELVIVRHTDFEMALFERRRRRYPTTEFDSFAAAVRNYLHAVRGDKMIHRSVAQAVHGLCSVLETARKKTPDSVMVEAQHLECLLFMGSEPFFDGDEPPGL